MVRGGAGPRRLASRGAPCLKGRGDLACSVFSCFPPPSALPGSLGVQLGNTLSYYPTHRDVRLIPAVHLSVSGEDTEQLVQTNSRQTFPKVKLVLQLAKRDFFSFLFFILNGY